ncbi:MAG: hypothetical protein ABC596_06890 [Candidatus Methanosuratincola petrocarbonis]
MRKKSFDKLVLERTRAHIRLRAMRKTVKVFLSHLFIVHHWLERNVAEVHYAAQYLEPYKKFSLEIRH